MTNVFPGWENLYSQIENYRKWLKNAEFNRDRLIKEQYNLMYENVYSILGSRGSGKTSAIFTLKEKIVERNKQDIVLPIVMPEAIPEGTETLGWILASLEEIVKEWSKKERDNSDSGIFSECHRKSVSLASIYEEVKELCYSRQVMGNGKTMSDELFRNERRNQSGYEFSVKLTMFWEELVKVIKKQSVLKNSENDDEDNKEPLIYLIFDDVDLNPERALEICSTIVKYLSHPNLIIILTADEELLYDVVLDSMLRKMKGILKYEDLEKTNTRIRENVFSDIKVAYDEKIRETASLYMSKVLPVSRRYPLRVYEECAQKRYFLLEKENSEDKKLGQESEETLEEFLGRNINEFINEIRKKTTKDENKIENKNFLYYNGQFLQTYLMFFGNTARQITETALVLKKFMQKLKVFVREIDTNKDENGHSKELNRDLALREWVKKFISDTMESRGVYWGDTFKINAIANNLIISKDYNIYIDYEYIYSLSESMINKNFLQKTLHERRDIINYFISLFLLSFFTENILKLMDPIASQINMNKRQKIHGHGHFVAMLDNMLNLEKGNASIIKREADTHNLAHFIYVYGKVIENYSTFVPFHYFKRSDVKPYCYAVNDDGDVTSENLRKFYCNNPKWYKTVIPMVWFVNRGVFAIDVEFYNDYLSIFNRTTMYGEEYAQFLNRIREVLIDIIINKNESGKEMTAIMPEELERKQEQFLVKYAEIKKCTIKNYRKVKMQLNEVIKNNANYQIRELAKEILDKMNQEKPGKNQEKIEMEKRLFDELFANINKYTTQMDENIDHSDSYWYNQQEQKKLEIQITDILSDISFEKLLNNKEIQRMEKEYIDLVKKLAYNKMKEEKDLLDIDKLAFKKLFEREEKQQNQPELELNKVLREAAERYIDHISHKL